MSELPDDCVWMRSAGHDGAGGASIDAWYAWVDPFTGELVWSWRSAPDGFLDSPQGDDRAGRVPAFG